MTDAIDDQHAVAHLLGSAQAILFDFDGPICDLFRGASTATVAAKIKRRARRSWKTLAPGVEKCDDSHHILRRLRDMYDDASGRPVPKPLSRRPIARAERIVARQELRAVRTAALTPGAVTLVDLLHQLDLPLVVVSNNSERPIKRFLKRQEMHENFVAVFGRDPENAGFMKPHPDCLLRAFRHLSINGPNCVLIGDQLTDLKAAQEAGTSFLGFTQDGARAREMVGSGADAVVTSYAPVIAAARDLLADRTGSAHSEDSSSSFHTESNQACMLSTKTAPGP
ncbi:HAD family phosphatase [Streptomyces sp. Root369]|uniref:HAD family hydrolase n=1 Tax=Streptomyces sp. Root369 TaxID=1736523 RepID=UPI00070F26B8|nr:HAD family phosphatase [Streptomyces sp. Root369]KQW16933.1 hypothetical protein ASD08_23695 [Streptomyces sp. Root369]